MMKRRFILTALFVFLFASTAPAFTIEFQNPTGKDIYYWFYAVNGKEGAVKESSGLIRAKDYYVILDKEYKEKNYIIVWGTEGGDIWNAFNLPTDSSNIHVVAQPNRIIFDEK